MSTGEIEMAKVIGKPDTISVGRAFSYDLLVLSIVSEIREICAAELEVLIGTPYEE